MFTTADSTRRAPLDALTLALLAAALLVASHAGANAQPSSRPQRGRDGSQKAAASLPAFGDYPARDSFTGRPAPVRLRTRRDRQYRTRLREGAGRGPNFAGRYTFVYWGCGTGCAGVAVVDAKTGLVYWPPQEYVDIPAPDREGYEYGTGHRLDSRLLVLTRSNYDRECSYTAYFYAFDRGRFRPLREALLKRCPVEGEQPPHADPADPK